MEIKKDYPCNNTNFRRGRRDGIKYIVIHYVGATGNAKNNAIYFSGRENIGSSAHYFVGHGAENGVIYQSVSDTDCAWHCGSENGVYYSPCRNDSAIGIEMCCHLKNGEWYFDEVTEKSSAELVRMLMKKYNIPKENVIRHFDVTHKRCPAPYVLNEAKWHAFKERLNEKSLNTEDDILNCLHEKKIITNRPLWAQKLKEDINIYYLLKKMAEHIVNE